MAEVSAFSPGYKPMHLYMLTLPNWHPNRDSFATNKDNITDWKGNIIKRKHQGTASLHISAAKGKNIDAVIMASVRMEDRDIKPPWLCIPNA